MTGYISRTQAVLQQGKPVVPVAYFYGQTGYYVGIEDAGAGKQAAEKAFLNGGYDFDRINPDSIAHAQIRDRQLVAASGTRYPVLVLPPLDGIRAETAEKIAAFAKAGLPVFFAGRAPSRDEGLSDAAARDARVRAAIASATAAGARVVPQDGVVAALRTARIPANLTFTGTASPEVVWVQRAVGNRIVTFVHNLADAPRDAGMVLPRLGGVTRWNAMDGTIRPVSARADGAGTRIDLLLAAGETALLVQDLKTRPAVVPAPLVTPIWTLPAGGWSLEIDGHEGRKPVRRRLGTVVLGDWRGVADLKAFSGTGTYRRSFTLPATSLVESSRVILDLGEVHDMATVTLNGKALPPAITAPFRVDLSSAVRAGVNQLTIAITNTPQNAMIDPKAHGYKMLKPVAAGLIGPIQVETVR